LARDVPASDAADLKAKVHRHARRIQRNAQRVANYFRHPPIAYAASSTTNLPDQYSAFNAVSAAQAESTMVVHREAPRTGCNGYPLSRMKRVTWSP
jgi:hypothetical protein